MPIAQPPRPISPPARRTTASGHQRLQNQRVGDRTVFPRDPTETRGDRHHDLWTRMRPSQIPRLSDRLQLGCTHGRSRPARGGRRRNDTVRGQAPRSGRPTGTAPAPTRAGRRIRPGRVLDHLRAATVDVDAALPLRLHARRGVEKQRKLRERDRMLVVEIPGRMTMRAAFAG